MISSRRSSRLLVSACRSRASAASTSRAWAVRLQSWAVSSHAWVKSSGATVRSWPGGLGFCGLGPPRSPGLGREIRIIPSGARLTRDSQRETVSPLGVRGAGRLSQGRSVRRHGFGGGFRRSHRGRGRTIPFCRLDVGRICDLSARLRRALETRERAVSALEESGFGWLARALEEREALPEVRQACTGGRASLP